ncbi:copper resistance CopC family protein [Catellatospora methionotrophica]|uniref:copper resistance CopC family protein n=1 Tax=Catellatospora methionotrophica TaxID=121620 RepID=UPI0033F07BAC
MYRKIAAVLAAVAVAVLLPSPAQAHGQLAFSDPVDRSTLTEPRESVRLVFTEKANTAAYFTVKAPDGTRVDHGWSGGEPKPLASPVQELTLRDGNWEPQLYKIGFPTVIPVSHWPQTGVYTITYQSVASDGDKVSGEVRFDYQGKITAAPAGWQPPTNQPDPMLLGQTATPQQPAGSGGATPGAVAGPAEPDSPTWPYWALAGLVAAVVLGGVLVHRRGAPRRR